MCTSVHRHTHRTISLKAVRCHPYNRLVHLSRLIPTRAHRHGDGNTGNTRAPVTHGPTGHTRRHNTQARAHTSSLRHSLAHRRASVHTRSTHVHHLSHNYTHAASTTLQGWSHTVSSTQFLRTDTPDPACYMQLPKMTTHTRARANLFMSDPRLGLKDTTATPNTNTPPHEPTQPVSDAQIL